MGLIFPHGNRFRFFSNLMNDLQQASFLVERTPHKRGLPGMGGRKTNAYSILE